MDVLDQRPADPGVEVDLVAEIRRVLGAHSEPLTLSKIRAALPSSLRGISLEDLAESLRRQVAANVLYQYPKYRSQQDRFWDQPMPVHIASLLRVTLEEAPLAWSELRRKLPAYALSQAEAILQEQVAQGLLHRHPRQGSRGKERYGVRPPDPKDYLRSELIELFRRMEQYGFSQSQLREAALELLHEEEWASAPAPGQEGHGKQPEAAPAEGQEGHGMRPETQQPAAGQAPEPAAPQQPASARASASPAPEGGTEHQPL